DRFHIFKNLTGDLCSYLKRTVNDRIKLIRGENSEYSEKIITRRQQNKIDTANKKWKTIKEDKRLYKEGKSKSKILKILDITRITVNNYLSLDAPPIKDSESILDNYIPLIIDNKITKEIYEEMKNQNYKGKMTILNMQMKSIRN
ncbi:MAG: hypothetical protein RSA91_07870, partial [Bacilli bacterium]